MVDGVGLVEGVEILRDPDEPGCRERVAALRLDDRQDRPRIVDAEQAGVRADRGLGEPQQAVAVEGAVARVDANRNALDLALERPRSRARGTTDTSRTFSTVNDQAWPRPAVSFATSAAGEARTIGMSVTISTSALGLVAVTNGRPSFGRPNGIAC